MEDWGAVRERLEQMVEDDPRWSDIRAALERDDKRERELAAVLSSYNAASGAWGRDEQRYVAEIAALRQRVEELERERDAAWAVRDAGWVQTEDALTRMRTAEGEVARLEGLILDWELYEPGSGCHANLLAEARRIRAQREEGA